MNIGLSVYKCSVHFHNDAAFKTFVCFVSTRLFSDWQFYIWI